MSKDFFTQPFTPERTAGVKARTSARPPPPPPGSGSNLGSSNAPPPPSSRANPPKSTINGGYYGNSTSGSSRSLQSRGSTSSNGSGNGISAPKEGGRGFGAAPSRPTGNYYPTAPSGNSTEATSRATPFPAYNPYGANANANPAANTNVAPSPYGDNDISSKTLKTSNVNSPPATNDGDDWFSSAQNEDYNSQPAPVNNMNDTSAPANANAAPTYMNPYAPAASIAKPEQDSHPLRSESMEMLSGSMSGPMSFSNPNLSNISAATGGTGSSSYNQYDFENEPPLLEELGINISHIKTKSLAVILPMKYAKTVIDTSIMEDNDLAGPLAFGLFLAVELLLAGKIHFGYIYGFGLFGCIATTLMLNLMSPKSSISVWTVVSILGYSLLPVNMLAALNVFYRIKYMNTVGVVLAAVTISWCTVSSTRLVERGFDMRDQRFLIGYPNALLYSAFVMLTIF